MKSKRKNLRMPGYRLRGSGRSGFTLLEMCIGMALTLGVASASMVMLSQHLSFLNMVKKFDFLRDDAPVINLMVSRILAQASSYRLYSSTSAGKAEASAVNTGANAIVMKFRRPNGTFDRCMIAFEGSGETGSLNFYNKSGGAWPADPSWVISSKVTNVSMSNDTGIVLLTLTGPNQEEITYVGSGE